MQRAFYKDLELAVMDGVYEPQEDSFLLADLVKVKPKSLVLDLGCGSGIISIVAGRQGADVIAVDINPKALDNAELNAAKYKVSLETRHGSMFDAVKERFDYIYFNPPYLPHEPADGRIPEAKAWDGGLKGREFTLLFIDQLKDHLKPKGKAFLLVSSTNEFPYIEHTMKAKKLRFRVASSASFFFEELRVYEITS